MTLTPPRKRLLLPAVSLLALTTGACGSRLHGRYQDPRGNYVDFSSSRAAFTNIGAGGGETEISYERQGTRVTLHELDGNPTLQLQKDGSLCCGPGGVLTKQP